MAKFSVESVHASSHTEHDERGDGKIVELFNASLRPVEGKGVGIKIDRMPGEWNGINRWRRGDVVEVAISSTGVSPVSAPVK
jgi:hypothetical protein